MSSCLHMSVLLRFCGHSRYKFIVDSIQSDYDQVYYCIIMSPIISHCTVSIRFIMIMNALLCVRVGKFH